MTKMRVSQLSQSGASDGEVIAWSDVGGVWEPSPSGGGGSGIPPTVVDAKGDLLVASAADTVSRLAVGTDGQLLTADSAQTLGVKWAASPGIPLALVDAKGDLILGSANDTAVRVPAGANGTILTADSTQTSGVIWSAAPGGGILATILDAKGDLIAASAADTPVRFAAGGDGTILTADSGQTSGLRWGSAPIPVSTIDVKGDLLVGTANDSLTRVGVGTDGQVLTAASTQASGVTWNTPPAAGVAQTLVDAKGDLLVASAADTVSRLAVGTDGQVLTADASTTSGLRWATGGGGGGSTTLNGLDDVTLSVPANNEVLTYNSGSSQWVNAAASGGFSWQSDLNNALTSLTGLTTNGGTWSIVSGQVQGSAAASNFGRAVSGSTPLGLASFSIVEVEVEVPVGFAGTGAAIGLILTDSTAPLGGLSFRLDGGNTIRMERDGQSSLGAVSYTLPAAGTWVKLRVLAIGAGATGFVDGVVRYELRSAVGAASIARIYPGIMVFATTARFRNLKAWSASLTLPS